jgi:hypothetical protein
LKPNWDGAGWVALPPSRARAPKTAHPFHAASDPAARAQQCRAGATGNSSGRAHRLLGDEREPKIVLSDLEITPSTKRVWREKTEVWLLITKLAVARSRTELVGAVVGDDQHRREGRIASLHFVASRPVATV